MILLGPEPQTLAERAPGYAAGDRVCYGFAAAIELADRRARVTGRRQIVTSSRLFPNTDLWRVQEVR